MYCLLVVGVAEATGFVVLCTRFDVLSNGLCAGYLCTVCWVLL